MCILSVAFHCKTSTYQLLQLVPELARESCLLPAHCMQDVNLMTYQLLLSQKCTIMFVGDRRQHIYAFNFAMDALRAAADEPHRRKKAFTLSHSFRLGPAVAEVANV